MCDALSGPNGPTHSLTPLKEVHYFPKVPS